MSIAVFPRWGPIPILLFVLSIPSTGWASPPGNGGVMTSLDNCPPTKAQTPPLRSISLDPWPLPVANSGLDHVAAGVGLRNRDGGTLELAGAPPEAELVAAYLYWGVITNSSQAPDFAQVELEGSVVIGTSLGSTSQPCWSDLGDFYAFRAEVTTLIDTGVNGLYRLHVPAATAIEGSSPWGGSPLDALPPLLEGASLVAVYTHPDLPSTARVYLHDGLVNLDDHEILIQHPLSPAMPQGVLLRHTRLGADGQTRAYDGDRVIPFETWLGAYRDAIEDLTLMRGPGSSVDETSDWQGTDGGSETQLWDTQTTRIFRDRTNLGAALSYHILYRPTRGCPPPEAPVVVENRRAGGGKSQTPVAYDAFNCVVVVAHALSVR